MAMTPDQVIESKHAMEGMAEILRSYYNDLRAQGFSRRDAFALVMDYQREIVRSAQGD